LRCAEIAAEVVMTENGLSSQSLLEEMLEAANLRDALERVKQNKGSAGIDGMIVEELPSYLAQNWLEIKAALLLGRYKPSPVKRVEIPNGSVHPAICNANPPEVFGRDLFRRQLRISTEAVSAPGSDAGASVCAKRIAVRGRH
jgi:hypothetical protein